MKNIIIIGNCRAGKTLLARELMRQLPNWGYFGTDHMRSAIMRTLVQDVTDWEHDPRVGEFDAQWGPRLVEINKRFFKSHMRLNRQGKYFIMEGTILKFDMISEFLNRDDVLVVCVGKAQLSVDEYFKDIRAWDQENHTWTSEYTDAQLRDVAQKCALESQANRDKCRDAHVMFVDTSFNQMAVITAAARQIADQAKA